MLYFPIMRLSPKLTTRGYDMPRPKKSLITDDGKAPPVDPRSKERKAIDRARSFVMRLDQLCKPGFANIAPAAKLVTAKAEVEDEDDRRALMNLRDEASEVLEYLPIIGRKLEQIATGEREPSASLFAAE